MPPPDAQVTGPGDAADAEGLVEGLPAGPLSDPQRLAAVRRVVQAGPARDHLERTTRLAADLLGAPRAQVSLLGEQQLVWGLHGAAGDPTQGTPPSESLCRLPVEAAAPVSVEDARNDPRARDLPPVTSGAVAAYLGAPLVGQDGLVLGALCVYDDRPRRWSRSDVRLLDELAQGVVVELELRSLTLEAASAAARLELALEASGTGSFDLDVESGELVWDDRLLRLFDYERDAFSADLPGFWARVHPEDRDRVEEALAHAVETEGEYAAEYRIVRPDGVRWVEARGHVVRLHGGRRLFGVAYDSTELRDARDRLARLLETMTDAFFSLDREYRFTYVNRQAELLLGFRRDELLGRDIWDAFPEALGTAFERHYRHAVEHDEPVSFEAPYAPLAGHYEVSAWPGPDGLSVYFREVSARRAAEEERERAYADREQAVVERERAYATAEAANTRLALLGEASLQLAGSLQPDQVLETLTDLVVPTLGQAVVVALTAETATALTGRETPDPSALVVVHVAHAFAERQDGLRTLVDSLPLSTRDDVGVGKVVRTRRPEWLPSVPDESLVGLAPDEETLASLRALAVGSALSLPLVNRGRVLGALTVTEPAAHPSDLELLSALAARAAVALDNALLYRAQERTAETLQRSLLPREVPDVPGVRTSARYLPGSTGATVGGDWYQGVRVGRRLLLAMGDVMGHGMRSAARMGQLRAIVATLALEGHGPQELLDRLARSCDVLLDLELATLLVAVLDPDEGTLTVASAGHPPPLLAPPGAAAHYVEVEPGPPLGTLPGTHAETTVPLAPGSLLVLYTDGLVEQRGSALDDGLERLRAAATGLRLAPSAVADALLEALDRKDGGDDDVALLVLSWDP